MQPDLEGFLAWAKMTGSYQVTEAHERYQQYLASKGDDDGRQDESTDEG